MEDIFSTCFSVHDPNSFIKIKKIKDFSDISWLEKFKVCLKLFSDICDNHELVITYITN